jgi:hypothetical protein
MLIVQLLVLRAFRVDSDYSSIAGLCAWGKEDVDSKRTQI